MALARGRDEIVQPLDLTGKTASSIIDIATGS
jgi:hypothetical protein